MSQPDWFNDEELSIILSGLVDRDADFLIWDDNTDPIEEWIIYGRLHKLTPEDLLAELAVE